MFGKTKLYERLLEEKNAQIQLLTALLHDRRIPLPVLPALLDGVASIPDGVMSEMGHATWESEAEEAEQILAADPTLSKVHLSEILDGLGYGNSDLS